MLRRNIRLCRLLIKHGAAVEGLRWSGKCWTITMRFRWEIHIHFGTWKIVNRRSKSPFALKIQMSSNSSLTQWNHKTTTRCSQPRNGITTEPGPLLTSTHDPNNLNGAHRLRQHCRCDKDCSSSTALIQWSRANRSRAGPKVGGTPRFPRPGAGRDQMAGRRWKQPDRHRGRHVDQAPSPCNRQTSQMRSG